MSWCLNFIAEGFAGAWRAAVALNDTKSWRRAVGFVKTLTLERSDVFPFALSGATVGGVRCTLSR